MNLASIFSSKKHHPYTQEDIDIIRLIRSQNVGPRTFYSLVRFYGSASKALTKIEELSIRGGKAKPIVVYTNLQVEEELAKLDDIGAGIVTYKDSDYPKMLKHIPDAPPVITYLGNKKILSEDFCAIVGSRNGSLNGRNFTSIICKKIVSRGLNVVSGLARGIDTEAHNSSLPKTVAVIAGGIDHIYPPENTKLYNKIIEQQGAIIAELPIGSVPLGQHFPQRNRIIAGMSILTLVIEASLKSGSLITARFALEQGREVCAVPGFPLDPRCQGTNKLIKAGAHLIESYDDLEEIIAQSLHHQTSLFDLPNKIISPSISIDEELLNSNNRQQILSCLSSVAISIDELYHATNLPLPIIYTILLEYELAGKIVRANNGGFIRLFS